MAWVLFLNIQKEQASGEKILSATEQDAQVGQGASWAGYMLALKAQGPEVEPQNFM